MARLNAFSDRKTQQQQTHIGKIVLFCEGTTERNYFDYFANIINHNKNKYSHIEIVPLLAEGNARRVLNYAENYLSDDLKGKRFYLFDKYLVFDCDAPEDIQIVINDMMKSSNNYKLLVSNLLFETWLLMHYENLESPIKKSETYSCIAAALGIDHYGSKEKAMAGIIAKIVGNGDSIKRQ